MTEYGRTLGHHSLLKHLAEFCKSQNAQIQFMCTKTLKLFPLQNHSTEILDITHKVLGYVFQEVLPLTLLAELSPRQFYQGKFIVISSKVFSSETTK